jgi:predicted RNase H-like HicB family nuclease
MLIYKAMYKFFDDGVHGEVLDFAGVVTCGKSLDETRLYLSDALAEMAETNLLMGEALPQPNQKLTDKEADLEEPIYLFLNASTNVKIVPELIYETA